MTLYCRACDSYALGRATGTKLFGRSVLRYDCLECGASGAVRSHNGELRITGALADDGDHIDAPEIRR